MRADLHVHTNVSDGSYGIEELIDLAKAKGLTHLGITNHDTVRGLYEMQELGKKEGLEILPGIEISAYDPKRKRKVHLLGYGFEREARHIRKICDPLLAARHENTLWQLEEILKMGYKIEKEAVLERAKNSQVCYKQHIMAELMAKGYTDKIYSDLYQALFKGSSRCSKDIAYVPVWEALAAIKADKGWAVLAHPGQSDAYELIDELVEQGLDGLELCHKDHTLEDKKRILHYAKQHHLILTGGSDFHGTYGYEGDALGSHLAPESTRLEEWLRG